MGTIEKILKKLDSYLYTIKRDTVKGWYVLEMGIPTSWTYKSTGKIECEETASTEKMAMVQINPTEVNVSIDDLLNFAIQITINNKKIEKMRNDFEKKMSEIKEQLAEEYEKFEDEIEDMEDGLFDEEKKVSKTVKKEDKVETE